ncbi:class I SAM-dependent methyltransferase [Actinomycetes bacterium KLBMP 9759]
MDDDRSRAFGARLLGMLTGHTLTMMIGIGHRTGLFAAAAQSPATSEELAERAGLTERYVREWLGAMVTGGIMEYDEPSGRCSLPAEHAEFLTGERASNVGPVTETLQTLGAVMPQVERCFSEGGGVPFGEYAAVAGESLGATWRYIYPEQLLDGFVGAVPGLTERLTGGVRVLDLGCGSGLAINLLAEAFPRSEFVGVDIAADAVAFAEAERARIGSSNARFEQADAAELPRDPAFDVIMAFDAIHDQHSPDVVLRKVREALAPGGVFMMVDTKFSRDVARNIGNPHAPMIYSISTLFCVPASLADGGAALGAVWGTELAAEMLADAGFGRVRQLDSPRPQNCIFVCEA